MITHIARTVLKKQGFPTFMVSKVRILNIEIETAIEHDHDNGLVFRWFGYDKGNVTAERSAEIDAEIRRLYPTKPLPQTHEFCNK